jgi:nucleotide-binding universal stress UspA family protein
MTYKSVMVHLELDGDNDGVLKIAGELARRFEARVIGIVACQPIQLPVSDGLYLGEAIKQERQQIKEKFAAAERQFRSALQDQVKGLEWRSAISDGPLADYIAQQARAADLIITGRDIGSDLVDQPRRVKLGDLVMGAGRPVLIVPKGITTLAMRHVMAGWKDSREARRALADALPFLEAAGRATVLSVTSQQESAAVQAEAEDVAAWLRQHRVEASAEVMVAAGTEAGYLRATLLDRKCDLLVAGAYGHNRLREWIFGGVTEDALTNPPCCVLFSH